MNDLCYLILLFFIASVLGWCMEVILKAIEYHRFINRGFLIGPYCPIYGAGTVFVTVGARLIQNVDYSYGTTFVISFVLCGALEYFVSYYLEKRFHARWWDYSKKPMNLHGRVWIGNLLIFGVGGTFIVEGLDPTLFGWFSGLTDMTLRVLSGIIIIIMTCDYISSHFVMKFVKVSVENSQVDSTESIGKEIRLLLSDKSILHKRIADAYPDVIFTTEKIKEKMEEVKEEMEHLREEALTHVEASREKLEEQKQNFQVLLESTSSIKDDIIEEQTKLISLLEEENRSESEIMALRQIIDSKKEQLNKKKNLPVFK